MIDSILTISGNILNALQGGLITHVGYGQFVLLFSYDKQASTRQLLEHARQAVRLIITNIRKLLGVSASTSSATFLPIFPPLDGSADRPHPGWKLRSFSGLRQGRLRNTKKTNQTVNLDMQEEKSLMNSLTALDFGQVETQLKEIFKKYKGDGGQIPQNMIRQLLQIGMRFQQHQQMEVSWNANPIMQRRNWQPFLPGTSISFSSIIQRNHGTGPRIWKPEIFSPYPEGPVVYP